MKRRWYIDGDMFVQETTCPSPMVANKMHTHKPERSHLTSVTSGAVRIFDSSGWEIVVLSGETVDLCNNLEHEIVSIEPDTVFKNIIPASRLSEDEIQEYLLHDRQINGDRG